MLCFFRRQLFKQMPLVVSVHLAGFFLIELLASHLYLLGLLIKLCLFPVGGKLVRLVSHLCEDIPGIIQNMRLGHFAMLTLFHFLNGLVMLDFFIGQHRDNGPDAAMPPVFWAISR